MITSLEDIIAIIENPNTAESEREEYISKLNIYGYSEEAIKAEAWNYWHNYFSENLRTILEDKFDIESHLLDEELIKSCFTEVFEEYKNRKKDLGIDDIRKYWTPI